MAEKNAARLGVSSQDYARFGIKKGEPEPWEDGVRTEGRKGEYEWWYFDGKLEDGSSLVVEFHTTPLIHTKNVYEPFASIHLSCPDGTDIKDEVRPALLACSFSKERCHAQIGDCLFEGDLHDYTIRFRGEKVSADITLSGTVPAWRPASGIFMFGEKHYFAWLPSVPEGKAQVSFTFEGKTQQFSGTGYHDHNWGDVPMNLLMHHWYWGRARIGEYQVISSYITAQKKYGYVHFPVFLLAKNGEKIGDDLTKLTYTQSEPVPDEETGKHIHRKLVYAYEAVDACYRITYRMEKALTRLTLQNSKQAVGMPWVLRKGMELAGISPSYERVSGTVSLEKIVDGKTVETAEAPALWEQMYFGKDEDV